MFFQERPGQFVSLLLLQTFAIRGAVPKPAQSYKLSPGVRITRSRQQLFVIRRLLELRLRLRPASYDPFQDAREIYRHDPLGFGVFRRQGVQIQAETSKRPMPYALPSSRVLVGQRKMPVPVEHPETPTITAEGQQQALYSLLAIQHHLKRSRRILLANLLCLLTVRAVDDFPKGAGELADGIVFAYFPGEERSKRPPSDQ